MRRLGYQFLGYAVWNGVKSYVRQRYGAKPRKLAVGLVLGGVLAAALIAARRQASGSDD